MARILLIKASDLDMEYKAIPSFLMRIFPRLNMEMVPPLGIMYCASVLRQAGHEVRIIDLRAVAIKQFSLAEEIRAFAPDLAGISALTVESSSMHDAAAVLKGYNPDIPVIAGGPHPTSYPDAVLADPHIDFLVRGEGERTIVELADALLSGKDVSTLKGIAFRHHTGVAITEPRPFIRNLDSLPFPAWDLIDRDLSAAARGMGPVWFRPFMGVFTSRACPYRCIYCHSMFGKSFRARSPENVIREMEILIAEYGIRDFEFYDDIFNLDRTRAERIFDLIIERNLQVTLSFPNGLRSDLLDGSMLKKMKRAGVSHISIAVESASPRIQKEIRKNLNLRRVSEAIDECDRLRIFTRGFFMLGFPTEKREDIMETIRFSAGSRLHSAMFFIVIPFQGTELGSRAHEQEAEVPRDFVDYDYWSSPVNLSDVKGRGLEQLQSLAYRRFYLNLRRLWRIWRAFPQRSLLWKLGLGAFLFYMLGQRGRKPDTLSLKGRGKG